jgi:hypothetical protein
MAKPQSPARKDRGFAFPALKLGFCVIYLGQKIGIMKEGKSNG